MDIVMGSVHPDAVSMVKNKSLVLGLDPGSVTYIFHEISMTAYNCDRNFLENCHFLKNCSSDAILQVF